MAASQEILEAVGTGDAGQVERLLQAARPGLAASYTEDGWSLLHLAANVHVARLLLDHGADVNAKNRHRVFGPGNTPLHAAVYMDRVDVAKLLLDRGADVNATDDRGWTPLHLAASNGHVEAARLLLERGADVVARTSGGTGGGQTALQMTETRGRARDDGTVVAEQADEAMAALLRERGAK